MSELIVAVPGGPGGEIVFTVGETSLGLVLVAWSDRGLRAVLLGDDDGALEGELGRRLPRGTLRRVGGSASPLPAAVWALLEAPGCAVELPLDPGGTAFQRSVWNALGEIPAGETASYSAIARRIGRPHAVRAVGQACGANPLAVVVPCHRAVRADGGMAGYRWGVERKRALLRREAEFRAAAAGAAG